jgi:hypothetical protein
MSIILRVTNDKGEVFDLQPINDIDLRLDISAIENTEIGTSFGISSQEFAIAGTNEANQFFGNLYNLGATPAVALINSVDCQVLNDSQEVFTGKLYIRDIITDQQGYTIYNTVVVNETIDFKYRIQNLSLNDPSRFDFSAFDHNFTAANVTGSWSNNLFSGSIIYPNIHYGNDGNPDCPNYAFAGLNTAAALENTIDNFDSPLRLKDFKPAIKVKDVIDVIFSGSYTSGSTGYQYTSSFFESAYFNDLYLLTTANDALGPANTSPISQSAWVFRSGSTQTFTDGVEGNIDFNSKSYDNSGNYNLATDRYTADENGTYRFTGQIAYNIGGYTYSPFQNPQMNVVIRVKKIVGINETIIDTFTRFNPYATGNSFLFQGNYDLDAGDEIRVTALFSDPAGAGKTMVLQPGLVQTFLQVSGPTTIEGSNVNMSQQFPDDLKALDFIQGIIEKFNLVVEPVPNRKNLLSIEPYNTWFDSGAQVDYTDKIDRNVNFSISSPVIEQPRTIIFSDVDDDDYLNLYTKEVFNKTYGQYIFTSDSDLAEGERKIGKVFAPTPTTNIPNSSAFIIPHLCTKPVNSDSIYKPMTFKPRLLYGIGIQNVESAAAGFSGSAFQTASYWLKDELNNVTRQSTWYQVSSLTETPITGSAFDLHYNNNNQGYGAVPPYWSNVVPAGANFISGSGDAFTTYWANYINGLYDIDSRKLVCNVYLTPSEIPDIRLNQKVFIDGAYYRINKINGANLSRRDSVEVEFIKTIARKLTFPRRRVRNTVTGVTRDVQFQGQNPNGGGVYNDFETGLVVNDFDTISQAGPLDGLRVFPIGVGNTTASAVWNYSEPTIPILAQTSIGTNTVSADSSKVLTLGSKNSIGASVSTATALGQFNTIEQNVTNAFVIGQQNTIGETSQNTQILGGTGNTISGSNNVNMTIMSSTGSTVSNSDYSTMINGYNATILDSDNTVAINSHENEVIVNGSGHVVIGLNLEGAGLDLLNTRNNSNWLGDTYIGEALFQEQRVLSINDGDAIDLSDNTYLHDSLFILDWTGLSPATASITLPNAVNSDYKNIIYTFVTTGSFVGSNGGLTEVYLQGFSGQKINGQDSYIIKNPYQAVTLTTSAGGWITLNDNVTNTYGAFYATGSQALAATGTQQAIILNDGWEDYGINISGSSKLVIENPGTYQLIANLQVNNLSSGVEDFVVWLKFNGTNWPFSSKHATLPARKSAGVPSAQIVTITFVGTSQAPNDYVELFMAASSTNVSIDAYAGDDLGAGEPAAPSISVMITPVI